MYRPVLVNVGLIVAIGLLVMVARFGIDTFWYPLETSTDRLIVSSEFAALYVSVVIAAPMVFRAWRRRDPIRSGLAAALRTGRTPDEPHGIDWRAILDQEARKLGLVRGALRICCSLGLFGGLVALAYIRRLDVLVPVVLLGAPAVALALVEVSVWGFRHRLNAVRAEVAP
jgi:hypothetical protein